MKILDLLKKNTINELGPTMSTGPTSSSAVMPGTQPNAMNNKLQAAMIGSQQKELASKKKMIQDQINSLNTQILFLKKQLATLK